MRFERKNIRECWEEVRPYIFNMLKGFDEIPEDIYTACINGQLHLFTCPDGFIICQEGLQPLTGDREMFVWFCQGYTSTGKLLEEYDEDIRQLGRMIGAKKLVFASKRRGFEKALGPNWSVRSVLYETEIKYV